MKNRHSNLKSLATVLTLSILSSACLETVDSTEVDSGTIHQRYSVIYSEADDMVTASASFHVGGQFGTTIRLQAPSRVSLNGRELQEQNFLGISYTARWREALSPAYSWNWIDQEGKNYQNQIVVLPIGLSSIPREWSSSQEIRLTTTGPALQSQDTISIQVQQHNPDGTPRGKWLRARIINSHEIRVTLHSDSDPLISGNAEVIISRERQAPLQEATERGGLLVGSYRMAPFSVQIQP